ncbi:hypothetical protein AYM40_26695 [Paraburkholderia phytofirmans OLGA172]|uniref:Epoxide hydrolase N-terminal domain-containing protein n=1 Tax=Paraburkholderia phytofirmans OLGA172 TaxID=1417228 RepID=A0A160FSM7_9BURK|nr:hypothetical protein [Paraburkholderia phytofirmans]ANB75892.1 hypothetical protein AYM40_26695 [Paraburkholderia phytofirmans OLGA172]
MALAQIRPEGLLAAHVSFLLVVPEKVPANPTPEEKIAYDRLALFWEEESGYFKQQSTRPQTLGYSLADSAAGQAMWLYEKYRAWSDNQGEPEDAFTTTQMLDAISIYWFTNSAASSSRMYWEMTHGSQPFAFSAGKVELPMAATRYRKDSVVAAPKAWAEALWPNLYYWNEAEKGNHWGAWEDPGFFSLEMRKRSRIPRGH